MYILFMVLMGLRKSEISGLKYSDIDYENHTIKISRQFLFLTMCSMAY